MTDTANGTVNADIQPEVSKLPTLAFSVTSKLAKFLETFKYTILDNVVGYVDANGDEHPLTMQDKPVGYSRLLPNGKGITPKAEAYNGTLADSNALKLHLYVEANALDSDKYPAVEFLSDDELSIARLIPSEKNLESTDKQLSKILANVESGKSLTPAQTALVLALAAKVK